MTINNKTLYTAWLIVSFISCWGINLTSSYAKDAQTNFTTQFDYNGPTCEVTTDNSHISVSLGSVEMSSFKSKGDMSNAVPFNINLDCQFDTPDGVQVRFKGVSPMEDNSLLALDGAGGMTSLPVLQLPFLMTKIPKYLCKLPAKSIQHLLGVLNYNLQRDILLILGRYLQVTHAQRQLLKSYTLN